jgi:tetratricopeptide (TPR) repeat protein
LAQIIQKKTKNVWDAALLTTSRKDAENFILKNKVYTSLEYFYGRSVPFACNHILFHPEFNWSINWDCKVDPSKYLEMDRQMLSKVLDASPKILRTVKANKSPVLLKGDYALNTENYSKIGIDEINRRVQILKDNPAEVDGLSAGRLHVYMRFGMWDELVDFPEYPEDRKASRAIRSYTRTVALANLRRTEEARLELARFQKIRQEVPEDWFIGYSPADWVMDVAEKMAHGEILWHEGKTENALASLREAVQAEDKLLYAEPPGWMIPVRHALGAILVAAGQHSEAVTVYQTDLEEHPNNAWALLGLSQALHGLGRIAEAEALQAQLDTAWANADVSPPASCYCGV